MAVVAAVLHMGNIQFTALKSGSEVANPEVLSTIAEILDIDENKLERRMTHENMMVVGKQIEKVNNPNNPNNP